MTQDFSEIWMVIEDSAYTLPAVAMNYGFSTYELGLYASGRRQPRQKTRERLQKMIDELRETRGRKMKFHPSYGYASEEQIERLRTLGVGPERDRILADIARQTKNKGKLGP